ncbi:unnamed protein product [Rotaria sordida]|uniref:Uncharacterized protein n=1 Tax=Rotaria sordida TaxID=392033 RepID=A0A815AUW1_9BILA|nr:unnamed protein product [Rotaria sordida]CAF1542820.1 unnamed protein product [Rotaria sordida]
MALVTTMTSSAKNNIPIAELSYLETNVILIRTRYCPKIRHITSCKIRRGVLKTKENFINKNKPTFLFVDARKATANGSIGHNSNDDATSNTIDYVE